MADAIPVSPQEKPAATDKPAAKPVVKVPTGGVKLENHEAYRQDN